MGRSAFQHSGLIGTLPKYNEKKLIVKFKDQFYLLSLEDEEAKKSWVRKFFDEYVNFFFINFVWVVVLLIFYYFLFFKTIFFFYLQNSF
jgi:hypothetical protein